MKVVVSGGSGFVGSAITKHLLLEGHSVRVISRSAASARERCAGTGIGREGLESERLTFVEADVTESSTLIPAVTEVDAVIQAAQFSGAPVENPGRGLTYMNVDRNGTLNLLGAIGKVYGMPTTGPTMARFPSGAPHFLYMSGISVSPDSPYTWDRAKWQAEQAIRGSGLDWTIVRACWAFGPNDSALNRILHYSDLLPFVPIFGNGEGLLTPIFVEDLGRFFALLVAELERGADTTFGIGGPDLVTLNQFLRLALAARKRRRPILHIPKPIGRVQGALMRYLPGRPLSPQAVDFVAQAGAVSAEERMLLAGRFPDFKATPLKAALESYMD